MINFLRSTIFNILLYGTTALMCIFCLPGLLLPRPQMMKIVYAFVHTIYFLERTILGLDYEVRGAEHLPATGSYIVAAKHQSAYETFKLHILWADPAIVLKRELLRIPLWGKFLARIDPIAIDRKSGKESVAQVIDGAHHVKEQNRPMIIFPQGTRVSVTTTPAEKPYRIGVARMQEATALPIIPMATNTGVFWPKHKWVKRGGKVVFEFFPAIPAGQDPKKVIAQIEETIEANANRLRDEAHVK